MRVKTRILLFPVIPTCIFIISLLIALRLSHTTSGTIERLGEVDTPYLDGLNQFSAQLENVINTFDAAVADDDKKQLKNAMDRSGEIRQGLETLQRIEGKQAIVASLSDHFNKYYLTALSTARLFLGMEQGNAVSSVPAMREQMKVLRSALSQARVEAHQQFDQDLISAKSGNSTIFLSNLASAAVVVLSLGIGAILLISAIWRQLGGEPEYARTVLRRMAKGDFSQPIEVARGADKSLLAAVREMSQGLSSIVASVRSGADAMAIAASEIAAGNHDLSIRTEQQAASLELTTASLQALTERERKSAGEASHANQLVAATADVAQQGGVAVSRVVDTMDEINVSSKHISEIVGVIDSIAFQTNILALNAAVEAARAGEQGRGFAVVASEVRSLAHRSADAAKEIKELISTSMGRVASGSQQVRDAGATMNEIVASVESVSDMINRIAAASTRQSDDIVQINNAIIQLDDMTQQNSALVEQADAAATTLEHQAQALQASMAKFQI